MCIRDSYRRFRDAFAELIAQGVAEGSLRPVDPQATARVLVSLGVGLVLQGILDSEGADWGRTAADAVRIMLEGVQETPE